MFDRLIASPLWPVLFSSRLRRRDESGALLTMSLNAVTFNGHKCATWFDWNLPNQPSRRTTSSPRAAGIRACGSRRAMPALSWPRETIWSSPTTIVNRLAGGWTDCRRGSNGRPTSTSSPARHGRCRHHGGRTLRACSLATASCRMHTARPPAPCS